MQDSTGPQFVLGGARIGTSPGYQGTDGGYSSSSATAAAADAYYLNFYSTNSIVRPAHNGGKRYGYSLRCLAQ